MLARLADVEGGGGGCSEEPGGSAPPPLDHNPTQYKSRGSRGSGPWVSVCEREHV